MTKTATRVAVPVANFCTFCAHGSHKLCTGSGVGTAKKAGACECGGRGHEPTTVVAAAMRSFVAPDRFGRGDVAVLATEWRKQTGALA